MKGYITKSKTLSFVCEKCGKEITPKNYFFSTEEEMLKELEHQCKPR